MAGCKLSPLFLSLALALAGTSSGWAQHPVNRLDRAKLEEAKLQRIRQQRALTAEIGKCFHPPVTGNARAIIAFTLGKGGRLEGEPRIVEAGNSEFETEFARAAVAAIVKCAPYATPISGEIKAPFVAVYRAPPEGGSPAAGAGTADPAARPGLAPPG